MEEKGCMRSNYSSEVGLKPIFVVDVGTWLCLR